jgi:hypothetical protein
MWRALESLHGVIHGARQAIHEVLVRIDHHPVHLVGVPWPGQQQGQDGQPREIPVPSSQRHAIAFGRFMMSSALWHVAVLKVNVSSEVPHEVM